LRLCSDISVPSEQIEVVDVETKSLAADLEREHREIDEGIEAFRAGEGPGDRDCQALLRAIGALRRHIYFEEEFLFPPLREAGLVAPILVMLREHAQIWETLDAVERELLAGGSALALCHQLVVQLQHHNLKEEKVLYPQTDSVLTASAVGKLRTFLSSQELPPGWVCQKARP
jgi:hemerythrin-like domain-containing protein